jgi:hypothetical protein
MEWEMRHTFLFSGSETLEEVKKKIFETVWKILPPYVCPRGKHGTPDDVILKCGKVEIRSDEQLRELLVCSNCFKATFRGLVTESLELIQT